MWGTSASAAGTRTSTQDLGKIGTFLHPHHLQVHKVQKIVYHLVAFECVHHLTLLAPLELHAFLSKITICRFLPLPKILGQKAKATTKVTLTSHQIFSIPVGIPVGNKGDASAEFKCDDRSLCWVIVECMRSERIGSTTVICTLTVLIQTFEKLFALKIFFLVDSLWSKKSRRRGWAERQRQTTVWGRS